MMNTPQALHRLQQVLPDADLTLRRFDGRWELACDGDTLAFDATIEGIVRRVLDEPERFRGKVQRSLA